MGKQKLSPEGAKAKKERDLKYANSPDRKAKRADSQKKRREAEKVKGPLWLNGKDYDHNTGRFVAASTNRGGTQKKVSGKPGGTKNENAKKLKKTK